MKLKNAKDNKKRMMIILSISIAAVLFVPMLYSAIYLGSIWDVYGKINKVPVAFVNLDKTVTKDGKEYAAGKDIERNLRDNDKVAWRFVNQEEALKGVQGTDYYAVIEIPEDFSKRIADAKEGKFNNPEITYISNKGRNFVFSTISSKVAEGIKTEVSSSIQKEISKTLVDSLYDVKVSIKDASDGTLELKDGTQKLLDGSKDLFKGTESAANGSVQLETGLKTAASSSAKLKDGTEQLLNGGTSLSEGLSSAAEGSKQLQAGLKTMAEGESQVVNGSSSLLCGLTTMKESLTKPNEQLPLLVKGASDLNTNTGAIAQGADQLDKSISALSNAVSSADAILKNPNSTDAEKVSAATIILDQISHNPVGPNGESQLTLASNSMHNLSLKLQALKGGTQKISDGVSYLASGLAASQSDAAAGLDKLINGTKAVQGGSSNLLAGLNTASDKTTALVKGLDELKNGSVSLKDGLKKVNEGNTSLTEGLNTAAAKTEELSKGLKSLSSGTASVEEGLESVNEGVAKLNDGLRDGYEDMNNKLKFNAENMSEFVSEPVTLKDDTINNVKYYGEGFAPYFVSLSLWIGAMLMSAIFSIAKAQDAYKSRFLRSFLGRFLAGSALVALQALILSFTVIKALGLEAVSTAGFYGTNVFIAITFFSVMYGLSHAIGIMSTPIMFIVLLLQLASSGGTFPIETAPVFYRVVNKIIPMTYSVNNLRMTLSGINTSVFKHNMLVMLMFILIFMVGGALVRGLLSLGTRKSYEVQNSEAV